MNSIFFKPHELLQPYIDHYTYIGLKHEVYHGKSEWTPSFLTANGNTALVFVLNHESVIVKEDNQQCCFEPLGFVGQSTKLRATYLQKSDTKGFFVTFKPCGAYLLLGIPQIDCLNRTFSLSDILGSSAYRLFDELSSQVNPQNIKQVFEKFFLVLLERRKHKERAIQLSYMLNSFRQLPFVKMETILKMSLEYGYSFRSLERHMKEFVGLSPQLFFRIIRFDAALEHIYKMGHQCNWAQTACQFGYYDQTHFIKEFKHFYGKTPGKSSPKDLFINKDLYYK